MKSSRRPYQRHEKRLALAIWLIFQLLILAALIAPLYFYRQRLFGRTEYAVIISGSFAYFAWTWCVATRKVANGIRSLPEQQNEAH
jgi:hypothetical protein